MTSTTEVIRPAARPSTRQSPRAGRPTNSTARTCSTPGPRRRSRPARGRRRARARTSGTTTATRYLDFSSQLVNTNIGHQHPKVVAAIQEQAGRAVHVRARLRHRGPLGGRPADRRADPGRPGQDLLHQRRRRGRRERRRAWPGCTPAARRCSPRYRSLPRRHRDRDQPHRRPAPLAQRHGAAGVVHFFGPFLYRSPFHADHRGAGVRARAAAPGAT